MQEAKFVPPRKCPNCGRSGRKVVIAADWQGAKESATLNNDFDCPKCGKGFCGVCFLPDFKGNGRTWHCPHCSEMLIIPTGTDYKAENLN